MQKISAAVLIVCMLLAVSGCKTISNEAKYQLTKPVDCSTASYDIQILEGEKASVSKQALAGVRMVVPASAVIGILSGDYKNRAAVANGKYNKDIDAKIAEIKATCGIP